MCDNMEESQRHSIQQKKPDPQQVYFIWIYFFEAYLYAKLRYGDRNGDSSCCGGCGSAGGRFSEVMAFPHPDCGAGDVV